MEEARQRRLAPDLLGARHYRDDSEFGRVPLHDPVSAVAGLGASIAQLSDPTAAVAGLAGRQQWGGLCAGDLEWRGLVGAQGLRKRAVSWVAC